MGKKIILFVPSYPFIPVMLYFIEKYKFDSEIEIYTGLKDLCKFIEYFNNIFWSNKIKCFCIKIPPYYSKVKKNINIIMKIINFIKYLRFTNKMKIKLYNKYFKNKRDCKIYFFAVLYFQNYEVYYIKKLSNNNCICLMDMDTIPLKEKGRKILLKEYTLLLLLRSLIDKGMFDKHLELFTNGNFVFSHMSKIYIKKYIDYELEYAQYAKDVEKNYIKYLRGLSLKYARYRMIFFDQYFAGNAILIQSKKNVFFKKIIEIFIKYFGDKFAIKYHPGTPKMENTLNFNNIKLENILEQFIPGEYFYNENTKYYISYDSDTITNKYNYTRSNNIRISLLYLVPFKEESMRESLINIFKSKIKGTVLFPKSFAELENIFKDEMM